MANIGSFKKSGNEFQGEIVTLNLQAKGVRIIPETNRTNDNAPSHRVYIGRVDYACGSMSRRLRRFIGDLARSSRADRRHYGGCNGFGAHQSLRHPKLRTADGGSRPAQITSAAGRRSGIGELAASLLLNAVAGQISSSNLTPKSCEARRRFHRSEPSALHEERHVRRSNRRQSGSR